MNSRTQTVLMCLFFCSIAIVPFLPTIMSGGNIIAGLLVSDYSSIDVPYSQIQLAVEMLKEWKAPLWNRYICNGFPLLANAQPGCFYFVDTPLFLFLPIHIAFNLSLYFHLVILGIGAFFFMKEIKCSSAGALLTGIIIIYNAFTISHVELNTLRALAWLPIIFLFVERVISSRGKKRRASCVILSVVVACQSLAGYYPIIVYSLFGAVLYGVIKAICSEKKRESLFGVAYFFMSILVGICLSAIQHIPTIELFLQSSKFISPLYSFAIDNSLAPISMITLLFPFFYKAYSIPFDIQIKWYIGIAPLLFAIIGIVMPQDKRKKNYVWLFVALLSISIFIALGEYNICFKKMLTFLPFMHYLGRPYRFLMLILFSLAVIAGLGFDAAISALPTSSRKRNYLCVGPMLTMITGGIFIYFMQRYSAMNHAYMTKCLVTVSVISIAWVSLLAFYWRYSSKKIIFISVIIMITLADLFVFGVQHLEMGIAAKNDRKDVRFTPGIVKILEGENADTYIAVYREKNLYAIDALAANNNIRYGIPSVTGRVTLMPWWYEKIGQGAGDEDPWFYYRLMGASTVISDIGFRGREAEYYDEQSGVYLYRLGDPLPKVYFTKNPIYVKSHIEAMEILKRKNTQKNNSVVVEASIDETTLLNGSNDRSIHAVIDVKELPNEYRIDVRSEGSGLLVLRDTFYPGWKVFVDGVENRIYRVNGYCKGVFLGPGYHHIKFLYMPSSFLCGVALTIISMVIVIAYGVRIYNEK